MFALAILIGIYSYGIFALGLVHLLYPISVALFTLFWFISLFWWFFIKNQHNVIQSSQNYVQSLRLIPGKSKLLLLLLCILWFINLLGALAPELSFDALWYHLTIPKIFVHNHAITFLQGGLYYYSLMPKLVDLLFVPAVMFESSVGAKLIHFTFGILSLLVLYKISRNYLSQYLSLLVLVIFSSNLVVAWEATTAYIDLGRTFFEVMAAYGIVLYIKEKKELWLLESAIMLGFAVATKFIAIGSIVVFCAMILYLFRNTLVKTIKISMLYIVIALLISLPYFILSLLYTGNPIYPMFSDVLPIQYQSLSPLVIVNDLWNTFVLGADPINPIYIISAPLLLLVWKNFKTKERLIGIYVAISLMVWIFIPRTGGGRFILPYLPIFSLLVGLIINQLKNQDISKVIILIAIAVGGISIAYRTLASIKIYPVLTGQVTREEYLINNLNYSFGDFYDTTGYYRENLTDEDMVLIYGSHNLWYAEFPFVHSSYIQQGQEFNYILAPNGMELPERFLIWTPIHTDSNTGMTLYTQRGNRWVY